MGIGKFWMNLKTMYTDDRHNLSVCHSERSGHSERSEESLKDSSLRSE